MKYHFEALGDERFQQLCQAILVNAYPDVQCLPVGQPDGGRDAMRVSLKKGTEARDFVVFQVKYSKHPSKKKSRDAIAELIRSEEKKIQEMVERGVRAYHFMTNVSGTSHLDVGSIDIVNRQLSNKFGIDVFCWWRDDLERRIDANSSLKWSYPDILRATDLLEVLVFSIDGSNVARRRDALKSYLVYQAKYDAQLKFKQIDLQRDILDLFVDVPARILTPPGVDIRAHQMEWLSIVGRLQSDDALVSFELEYGEGRTKSEASGAFALMINPEFASRAKTLVVEGAPGQGKSTVTQYLCQIYRLLLLGKKSELDRIDRAHIPQTARIPFRVDLRDYASWLSGRNPFSDNQGGTLPQNSSHVLESFLAYQVHRFTGSDFNADDLIAITREAHILIVLDGFDEVADIAIRNKIVAEVSDAAVRIEELSISSQVIVTSRPAAFVNSPGFPRDEWVYIEISPLSLSVIKSYATKWLEGRFEDQKERDEVLSVLEEKLLQVHVRDLARNPMQLAILLALISVQGASLPDKRTALYDKYIDIFMNRESEKSKVVREHRDLLLQIHMYLAWVLQVDAETSGAGHISELKLRQVLRDFLLDGEHDVTLVEKLFSGMVERVVALVSRVQGTFEFEVQPLREYFAARFLYDTAPYSPVGYSPSGTKPERFDAIAKNFYWLNVTRFYAGCYSTGELASLIDCLDEIGEVSSYKNIAHIPKIGFTLLKDYVFSQHPKLAKRMIELMISKRSIYVFLSGYSIRRLNHELLMPAGPAREAFATFGMSLLKLKSNHDVDYVASQLVVTNWHSDRISEEWLLLRSALNDDVRWLNIGALIGSLGTMTLILGKQIAEEFGEFVASAFFSANRMDIFDEVPKLWRFLFAHALDTEEFIFPFTRASRVAGQNGSGIAIFATIFSPFFTMDLIGEDYADSEKTLRELVKEGMFNGATEIDSVGILIPEDYGLLSADAEALNAWARDVALLFDQPFSGLYSSGGSWSKMIEKSRLIWGDRWAFYRMAAAEIQVPTDGQEFDINLFDFSVAMSLRASGARANSGNENWWRLQFISDEYLSEENLMFAILLVFKWANLSVLVKLSEPIGSLLESLSTVQANLLFAAQQRNSHATGRAKVDELSIDGVPLPAGLRYLSTKLSAQSCSQTRRFGRGW